MIRDLLRCRGARNLTSSQRIRVPRFEAFLLGSGCGGIAQSLCAMGLQDKQLKRSGLRAWHSGMKGFVDSEGDLSWVSVDVKAFGCVGKLNL